MALSGYVDEISRGVVTGWAADLEPPGRPVEITITVNGERRTTYIYPEGLTKVCAGSTGRFRFEFRFNPPLSIFKDANVAIRYADAGNVINRGEKLIPAIGSLRPLDATSGMLPILINGAGRSGSTLLMQYLSLHPAVVVARMHPYEIKLVSYYAATLGPRGYGRSGQLDRS